MFSLPVKILYVVDPSALHDDVLDDGKCEYVAIGTADEGGRLLGRLRRARELAYWLLVAIRGRR